MRLLLASLLRRWADQLHPPRVEIKVVLPTDRQFVDMVCKAKRAGYLNGVRF